MRSSLDKTPADVMANQAVTLAAAGAAWLSLLMLFLISSRLHASWTRLGFLQESARPIGFLGALALAVAGILRSGHALRSETSMRGRAILAAWLGATIIVVSVFLFALINAYSVLSHLIRFWNTHGYRG